MAAVLPPEKRSANAVLLDRAGICVSALCLVQCLLLPIIVAGAPVLALPFFDSEIFHLLLLGLILPIGSIAFYLGYRVHASRVTVLLGAVGIGIVFVTAVFGHDHLSAMASALWTSLGGFFLITAHVMNLRNRRACLRPQP